MQDEITKHTKKIYGTVISPNHIFGEKVKEVVVEIFIIVFAITLSIWLHSWSEHRHQQAEVIEFLDGLEGDIESDIIHYEKDSVSFINARKELIFNNNLTQVRLDSLEKSKSGFNLDYTLPQIWCNFNDGRYEGFKSSGKIELIENKELKANILSYYQQLIPEIHRAEEELKNSRNQVMSIILTQRENESIGHLMISRKMKTVYGLSIEHLDWIIRNHHFALKRAREINAEIKKMIKK